MKKWKAHKTLLIVGGGLQRSGLSQWLCSREVLVVIQRSDLSDFFCEQEPRLNLVANTFREHSQI